MTTTKKVYTSYEPRNPQKQIHKAVRENRFVVVVAHRRMGKTVGAINQLIHSALNCKLKNPRYALISPTYSQSKRVSWDMLTEYTRPLDAVNNIAELRSDFLDGRRISLYGADNIDTLRGIYLDGVVIDEYAQINPSLFSEIIRPAIADRKGWVMFIGTPKGRNHFATLRDKAKSGKDGWKLLEFKASETGLVDQDELDAAKKEMGEDKYNQEFEVNFHTPVEGAYYGTIINDLEFKGQICDVLKDDIAKTFCSWDLGMGDSTAIFVAQIIGQEIHIIDYMENHGKGLDFYVNWLRDKRYDTAEMLLPHDIQVRELGTGKSRLEVLQESGLNCRVVAKLGIDDGIQAVRRILPRCWFDTKVKDAVDLLRNYRREYDEKRDVFFDKPVHDFTSHCADSFRYLAVGINENTDSWNKPLNINNSWIV